jgi:very-short-patch-repair endonuclease
MPRLVPGKNDLLTCDPVLASEWHPTKNGDISPAMVSHKANKKYWWLGKCRHEWDASVDKRAYGRGCPYCNNSRILSGHNDLLSQFPEIAAEWDYSKNSSLRPEEISVRSNKSIWWIDSLGHEWEMTPDKRTSRGQNCPFCAGARYLEGFNGFEILYPDLAKEWSPLNPFGYNDAKIRDNTKIWWIGTTCKHEWKSALSNRKAGSGCSICANKLIKKDLNSFSAQNPELLREWDYAKNTKVSPDEVASGSHQKVWWIGLCNHNWCASIAHRVAGKGCPVCANRTVIQGVNDLATTHPDIAKEFHPTKNGSFTVNRLVANSHKNVWWIDSYGHEWITNPHHRTTGTGCPVCVGKQIVVGFNDLASLVPAISAEWHPTKNGTLTPQDVTVGSGRKVWWLCKENHEYETVISSRVSKGVSCSRCSETSTSKIQQAFHKELSAVIPDLVCDTRLPIAFSKRKSMSVDMVSDVLKVVIEYDGRYYHSGQRSKKLLQWHLDHDRDKTQALLDAGYRVVRIRENGLAHLSMNTDNVLELDYQYGDSMDSAVKLIFKFIHN